MEIQYRVREVNNDSFSFDASNFSYKYIVENDNYILMLYTGYKDSNGKKIYVGDIVMNEEEWEESYKIESLHEFIYNVEYSKNHSELWGFTPEKLKIVGNIYE